jgi:chemotaxis signal transduction protein
MSSSSLAVIPLKVHDTWMAIEASAVQEILGAQAWVPIPGAAAQLPGVVPWRGRAIAVLDIGLVTGVAEGLRSDEVRRRNIVADVEGAMLAIPVHAVREVRELAAETVGAPALTSQRYAARETIIDGRPVAIVDLHAVVAELVGGAAP